MIIIQSRQMKAKKSAMSLDKAQMEPKTKRAVGVRILSGDTEKKRIQESDARSPSVITVSHHQHLARAQ